MRALSLLFKLTLIKLLKFIFQCVTVNALISTNVETDYREMLSLDVLCDGGEGDPLLSQPVSQGCLSKGISRSVNSSSIGHSLHLLQYDHP